MLHLKYYTIILLFFTILGIFCKQNDALVKINEGKLNGSIETLFDGSHYYAFRGILYAAPPVKNQRFRNEPLVKISEGKLRGSIETLFDGSHYYAFRGIPYAAPPVKSRRFRAPKLPKSWKGVRNALKFGASCTQFNSTCNELLGEEDCLFINVFTKSLNKNAYIPVMVYIYGGAFMENAADSIGPDFLIQHDVILVNFNYRSEVLGYLSLDLPKVPGNAAMKDQVAALRWVQRNIANFGGDPSNVTLFGGSSGATCVFLHLLSPMSKGLFHKAIAQSGNYDFAETNTAKERAFRLGKLLGKETDNVQELLTFLRNLNAYKLVNVTKATLTRDEQYRLPPAKFLPVVEKKFPRVAAFLDENPTKLIRDGKINRIPFMLGYNSGEGIMTVNDHLKKLEEYNKEPSLYFPPELHEKISQKQLIDFGDRIKKFYAGNKTITKNDLDIIKDIQSDIFYTYSTHRVANLYSSLCKTTYTYRFDFDTELNIMKKMVNHTKMEGASHVDEVFYLFLMPYINDDLYKTQPKLRDIVFNITKLWTNFAKTGRPTLDNSFGATWLPYTTSGKEYFQIGEPFAMKKYPDRERMEFWNELYKEAGLLHISD